MTDTTEKGLENLVEACLLESGYILREPAAYDKTACLDTDLFFEFLDVTQPKAVAKLQQIHGAAYRSKVVYRLNQQIRTLGIVDVLRNGFVDNNVKISVFFDRPATSLNDERLAQYKQNRFSVMRQVWFSSVTNHSLDMVLTVNGLPVCTLELKNELTRQTAQDAIKQYCTDRDPKEELFRLARCLVHFAVDTDVVFMCTHLTGESSFFLPFNKGCQDGAGNPPNPNGIKTDYLWREILHPDSLTNIIQNYVQFVEQEKEVLQKDNTFKTVKEKKLIFPRYHQLDVVRKLLADARQRGPGQRYLIQHSAGSGKSNSIAWLAHQLTDLHDGTGQTVVFESIIIVTDRIVLDKQLRANIRQFSQQVSMIAEIREDVWSSKSKQLKEALEDGKRIIVTTIGAFPGVLEQVGELGSHRFAILIDEAHSSQSGDTSGKMNATLGKGQPQDDLDSDDETTGEDRIVAIITGRKMLKNASYFAFTATPKDRTLELFGVPYPGEAAKTKFRAFHLYSMKQAIEEKFILDVLENYTTYNSYYALLKRVADDPVFDRKKAQRRLRAYVESHEKPIEQKATVMLDHFVESVYKKHKINGLAKAMIVTGSRRNAVIYKKIFDRLLAERKLPFRALVAYSGEIGGQTEVGMNGFSETALPKEFKKSVYRFLIVANKYQTGFDEPLLHTMYVDKKLAYIGAVQTLSRLNRTMKGKTDTFVLDMANSVEEIKDSFDPFFISTTLADKTDPNLLFDARTRLDGAQIYSDQEVHAFSDKVLDTAPVDELHVLLDVIAARFRSSLTEEEQEVFRTDCKSYLRLYTFLSQIVPFVSPYLERLFILLNQLYPKILRSGEDDLAKGILQTIDMDSYRLQRQGEASITLEQGDELQPQGLDKEIGAAEPELDLLSSIVQQFNERFGTQFSDEDKVRKMAEDLAADVSSDAEFKASFTHSDRQNARITFDKLLSEKLIDHINTNFEVYKAYSENPDFRSAFSAHLFDMVIRARLAIPGTQVS